MPRKNAAKPLEFGVPVSQEDAAKPVVGMPSNSPFGPRKPAAPKPTEADKPAKPKGVEQLLTEIAATRSKPAPKSNKSVKQPAPEEVVPEPDLDTKTVVTTVGSRFNVTPIGIKIDGDLAEADYNEWRKALYMLQGIESGYQWAIGDMLNAGQAAFGEKYADAVSDAQKKTWTNYASVCAQYKPSERFHPLVLPFGQHESVAYVDKKERTKLLKEAAKNEWSVATLRDEKKKLLNPGGESSAAETSNIPTSGEVEEAEVDDDMTMIVDNEIVNIRSASWFKKEGYGTVVLTFTEDQRESWTALHDLIGSSILIAAGIEKGAEEAIDVQAGAVEEDEPEGAYLDVEEEEVA